MKKRIIALLLSVVMVLSMVGMVSAVTYDLVGAGAQVSAKCTAGTTVDVPVSATSNAGIASGTVAVQWPAACGLTLKAVDFTGSVIPDKSGNTPGVEAVQLVGGANTFWVTMGDDSASADYTATGLLFTLKFEVGAGAQPGAIDIALTPEEGSFTNTTWTYSQTAKFDAGKVTLTGEIASPAEVAVTEPAKGAAPQTTISGDYYTGTIAWSPAVSGTFAANTAYTATVTLNANTGYVFKDAAAKVNGESVTGKLSNSNATLTFTKTFPATADKALDHLTVAYKNGGSKAAVQYLDGEDALKSQLNVTAVYDDASTEPVTSYTLNDFDAGKDTRPAEPKTDFPVAVGTDKKCEVAYGGLTAAVAYDVTPLDLAAAELTINLDRPWTGSPVSISGGDLAYGVKHGSTVLYAPFQTMEGTYNNDYAITASAGQEICTAADKTAYVTISGVNNFTGEKTFYFAITKATPELGEVAVSGDVYTSTALKDVVLTRTDTTVAGTLALDAGQTLTAGTKAYNYTFTPTDATHYETVTGTVTLEVKEDAVAGLMAVAKSGVVYHYGDTPSKDDFTVTALFASGKSNENYTDYTLMPATITGPDPGNENYVTITFAAGDVTATTMVEYAKIQIDASDKTFAYQYTVNGETKAMPADNKVTYTGSNIKVSPSAPVIEGTQARTNGGWSTRKFVGEYEVTYKLFPANANYEVTGQPTNTPITWEIVAAEQPLTAAGDLKVRPANTLTKEQLLANIEGLKGEPTIAIVGEAYGCSIDASGNFVAGNKTDADGHDVTVKVTAAAADLGGHVGGTDVESDGKPEYLANTEGATFTVHVQDKAVQEFANPLVPDTITYGQQAPAYVLVDTLVGDGAITYAVTEGDKIVSIDPNTGLLTIYAGGSAVITATAAETATYAETTKEIPIVIAKATQTITPVTATMNLTYGTEGVAAAVVGAQTPLSYSVVSGTDVIAVDATTGVLTTLKAGKAIVRVFATGDDRYNGSTPVEITVNVAKTTKEPALTTITAKAQKGVAGSVDLTEALANGGAITGIYINNESAFSVRPQVEGNELKFTLDSNAAGTVQVQLVMDGGDCYNPYNIFVNLAVTNKKIQTFNDTTTELLKRYGESDTVSTATNAGTAILYELKSGDDVIFLQPNGDFYCIGVGQAVIQVSAAETAEYEACSKEVTVSVAQKLLTLSDLNLVTNTWTLGGDVMIGDDVDFDPSSVQIQQLYADGTAKVGNFQLTGRDAAYYHITTESLDNVPVDQAELVTLTVLTENCTVDAPATSTYTKGATVTLTAQPNTNCKFYQWQVNGSNVSSTATYTLILNANTTVKALALVNNGGGTSSGGGIVIPNLDLAALLTKTQIILTIDHKDALVFGETKSNDVAPIIRNNRTMLPARFVAEALGAKVDWDAKTRTVIITNATTVIKLPVGSTTATVNGQSITLDSPAFIENNRTYTPIRFISEALNAIVEWNAETRQVTITKK